MTEHTVPEGARSNAVPPPAAWTSLLDVDPRVSAALLESLEDAGVAAYASPGEGTDHVVVDAAMRDLAEAVVAAELPGLVAELGGAGLVEPEVDPFEAIVAGWDAVPSERSWPAEEDVVRPARKDEDESWRPRPTPPPRRLEDEHFVPPPPPIPPAPQTVTRFAIAAIVLGLFVILGLPLLGTEPSQAALVLASASIVAGIGTLVWRMRDAPSVDDGPDDGAVV